MVNKRLLIKNMLSHNDESTFFDKKEAIDLNTDNGKSKFLKHVCALGNSNPNSPSFLIIGVKNDNSLIGIDFFDDSIIQNLVSAFLANPPIVKFENITFPTLKNEKTIGLLSIQNDSKIISFAKSIDKIKSGSTYHRIGSKSEPVKLDIRQYPENKKIISDIQNYSSNTIKTLLDQVFEFYKKSSKEYEPHYVVFKEQFVICWSGFGAWPNYSEVDIQIINEGVRLFFSAIREVKIYITEEIFQIDEYQTLGFEDNFKEYAFRSTIIKFEDNGLYKITKHNIFKPPIFQFEKIKSLYKKSKSIEEKFIKRIKLTKSELGFGEGLGNYFFICYLNGVEEAYKDFYNSLNYLDGSAAEWAFECKEILESIENDNHQSQIPLDNSLLSIND